MEVPTTTSAAHQPWLWGVRIAALASLLLLALGFYLEPSSLLFVVPFLAIYLLVLLGVLRTALRPALRVGRVFGVLGFVAAVWFLVPAIENIHETGWGGALFLGVFALTQAAVTVSTSKTLSSTKEAASQQTQRAWVIGFAMVVGAVFLLAAAVVLPGLLSSRRYANEAAAAGSVRQLNNCAAAYAAKHAESGFPASLNLLGPGGTNCIRAELATGQKGGYSFAYTPGARDTSSRISGYTISARPLRYGSTGQRSFFSDQSGVIRFTGEDRAATARDSELH